MKRQTYLSLIKRDGFQVKAIPASPLCTAWRSVIQSNKETGMRSILDQYTDHELVKKLRRNGIGNYYRYQQKLWPNLEALEQDLSKLHYGATERMPLALLPRRSPPDSGFICEGKAPTLLLEHMTHNQKSIAQNRSDPGNEDSLSPDQSLESEQSPSNPSPPQAVESNFNLTLSQMDYSIEEKILKDADLDETILASAKSKPREILKTDLSTNELLPRPLSMQEMQSNLSSFEVALRRPSSARDVGGTSWDCVGLDSLLAEIARSYYRQPPSRLQSWLLLALLNEDHNDVLFNGVTGSGKTAALILALLQGARKESTGMNILVAADAINAMQMYDTILALCRRGGGGAVLDRPSEDFSWLLLAPYREDYRNYYRLLCNSLKAPHGPVRIFITTASTFCELLFEKKLEFQDFGYLRRVYVDDIGAQIPMLSSVAPVSEVRERLRNPLAAELLLGTLHQLPGPHIRSILKLGLVSADVDARLKDHLKALCMKPSAQTIVLSPVRLPSTLHCLFSFYLHTENRYEYLVKLIQNARDSIPGRAVIFLRWDEDILTVRRTLRGLGMNAKIFSEVYGNGQFQEKWKFLLLRESEAFGIDIPFVSHVFVSFAPQSWQSFLHMSGRAGRLGNVGWVFTITDKREAKNVRRVVEDLHVDFTEHVVDVELRQVSPASVSSFTKEPEPYGMDPQYAVQQHYEIQAENPEMAYRCREFFSKPAHKQFQAEDYTSASILQRRFESANKLAKDVERSPSVVLDLAKQGLIDSQLRPTERLKDRLNFKTAKSAPSLYRRNK